MTTEQTTAMSQDKLRARLDVLYVEHRKAVEKEDEINNRIQEVRAIWHLLYGDEPDV